MSLVSKNIFAALDTKKKKKSSKGKNEKSPAETVDKTAELEKALFSQPVTGLSSWADESDEEDIHVAAPPVDDGWNEVRSFGGTSHDDQCCLRKQPVLLSWH
jgi:hypothetical protein